MKKIGSLCLIWLLAITAIFCVTACGSNPNDEDGEVDPSGTDASYEITVDASNVSVDTSEISVCIYSLNGVLVGEKKLSQGKTLFELDVDSYVATLSGLSEKVSYSSVLLTKSTKKATIVLEETEFDEHSKAYAFAFTVIVMAGDMDLDALDVQLCDDSSCRPVEFDDGNVADLYIGTGEYEVKVFSGGSLDALYHEDCTVTLDKRFCVIVL